MTRAGPVPHIHPDPHAVRIGDTEREQAAAELGSHMSLGRLDVGELETRLDIVYAARTGADLRAAFNDLPRAEPPAPAASRPAWSVWAPWALTGAICLVIWVATSLAQGRPLSFWPVWVIGPWGAVLLARTLSARITSVSSLR